MPSQATLNAQRSAELSAITRDADQAVFKDVPKPSHHELEPVPSEQYRAHIVSGLKLGRSPLFRVPCFWVFQMLFYQAGTSVAQVRLQGPPEKYAGPSIAKFVVLCFPQYPEYA
eukprot:6212839-Pleurochrysis_carterae.AAC.7